MDIKELKNKNAEKANEVLDKAKGAGKAAVDSIGKGATALYERGKEERHNYLLKKYNPLFPDVYESDEFNVPNIIQIVDDAVRKDVEVCNGAIGWTGSENGPEVLYLYDEFIADSGVRFLPDAVCDAVYCRLNQNELSYVRADKVVDRAIEGKIAELQRIASSLGAKECTIRIVNEEESKSDSKFDVKDKTTIKTPVDFVANLKLNRQAGIKRKGAKRGEITAIFEGSDNPEKPRLYWFKNSEPILSLIETRCDHHSGIKEMNLVIEGTASTEISKKLIADADAVLSKKPDKKSKTLKNSFTSHSSISSQLDAMSKSKFMFNIKF